MKKDRNCGCQSATPYPIYPVQGVMPMSNIPMQGMVPVNMQGIMPNMTQNYNTFDQMNTLVNQINNLEKRVTNLENLLSNTSYNTSNFQMM